MSEGPQMPEMTREALNARLDRFAKKRDHCVDVLGKPLLGLTYQIEIDSLVAKYPHLAFPTKASP